MIGNCDACERKNVPVSNVRSSSGETTQCFICQGGSDADPFCELSHDRDGKIIGDDDSGYSFSCSKCGAAIHSDDPQEGDWCLDCEMARIPKPLEAAKMLLINASVGSCTCNTKSPELMWHAPNCRFVLIMMALENVEIQLEAASALPQHQGN